MSRTLFRLHHWHDHPEGAPLEVEWGMLARARSMHPWTLSSAALASAIIDLAPPSVDSPVRLSVVNILTGDMVRVLVPSD